MFVWVYGAMLAMSFWESAIEGREAWDKHKYGWKLKYKKFILTSYHFWLFLVMLPLLLTLPLVVTGWDSRIFGIIASAYFSGMQLQDFFWYVFNPKVKFKEFFTKFSDYQFWLTIKGKKIIPYGYLLGFAIAIAFWYFLWR